MLRRTSAAGTLRRGRLPDRPFRLMRVDSRRFAGKSLLLSVLVRVIRGCYFLLPVTDLPNSVSLLLRVAPFKIPNVYRPCYGCYGCYGFLEGWWGYASNLSVTTLEVIPCEGGTIRTLHLPAQAGCPSLRHLVGKGGRQRSLR